MQDRIKLLKNKTPKTVLMVCFVFVMVFIYLFFNKTSKNDDSNLILTPIINSQR